MKILVVNSGGSSLKYKLYEMPAESVIAQGHLDRLGTDRAVLTHKVSIAGRVVTRELREPAPDHLAGIKLMLRELSRAGDAPLASLAELDAVAHKLPHGGEVSGAQVIGPAVEAALQRFAAVVPVHNPPVLRAIAAFRETLPTTPQCGTFETHFHATLEPAAYRYALPESWYTAHGIRRYGFHSCSHRYTAGRVAQILRRPLDELRLVACHLGSGTSVCGIRHGRSVEISSAFTPQAGTPMSTRPGDFDPFVLTYLLENTALTVAELNRELTTAAGLAGLSGVGGDLRDIEQAAAQGESGAKLALDVFVWNIRRWIGACLLACGGVDVISFTGGIGENDPLLRRRVCAELAWLGVELDELANQRGGEGIISTPQAAVQVVCVAVDEEIVVARDAYELLAVGAANG
ncbi:MAG: acetate/propionate family kinase [Fimbriimonadaceae bacterium]|nr:acetate/propionate family kinase [Fimbriimonadaceae bacterium]